MHKLIAPLFAVLLCAAATAQPVSFTGRWRTNWGIINLIQTGSQVNGTYTGNYSGSIQGVVTDRRLNFTWKQPEGLWGRGYFDINRNDNTLQIVGRWGAGISENNGGEWVGVKDRDGYN